jgi:hypothetical protein
MALCDTSILNDLPSELSKLTGRIVRKWWAEHGLLEAAHSLRMAPEVSIPSMSCYALLFCAVVHLTYAFSVCLIQTKGVKRTNGANNEQKPEGDGNDKGPSALRNGGDVVQEMIGDHQDATKGDQDREV